MIVDADEHGWPTVLSRGKNRSLMKICQPRQADNSLVPLLKSHEAGMFLTGLPNDVSKLSVVVEVVSWDRQDPGWGD
jgi:hypothetical protein